MPDTSPDDLIEQVAQALYADDLVFHGGGSGWDSAASACKGVYYQNARAAIAAHRAWEAAPGDAVPRLMDGYEVCEVSVLICGPAETMFKGSGDTIADAIHNALAGEMTRNALARKTRS